MKKYAIGVDNGGTVSKAAVFDIKGNEIAVVSRQTPLITARPGYNERDMEELWLNNCRCIKEAIEKAGISPSDIIGLSVCGHGKGLYPWGKDGKPAYNGIVSTDNRAWEYAEKWTADGTLEAIYPQICQKLIAGQQAALLRWLKENDREAYDNIQWVFSVKDYIRFRLTGEAYCEATDISGSGLMDIKSACFDIKILEMLGIEEVFDKLAPIKYSSENCGSVTKGVSALTGLLEGTPVWGGMFDIDACAIAMAVTEPEQLCTITGTWSINEFISPVPITGTSISMNSLYAIPGYYLLEECSPTSAGNMDWFIKNLMENEKIPQDKDIYSHINELVASVKPEECDVYYLPFLYGSNNHPLAKAGFIGLTTYHTKAHMLRAVYEGVAFSHKYHIEKLLSARKPPSAIRMAGGAVNSEVWVKIFADVLGYPIETVTGVKELGALGGAMAAAVGAGIYRDYKEAAKAMVCVNEPVLPHKINKEIYEKKYRKYRAIVNALEALWDDFTI